MNNTVLEKCHFRSKSRLILFATAVFMFVGCSRFECKRLAVTEVLPEFESFIEFIDTSDLYSYNLKSIDTKCYYIDSLIIFVKFNHEYQSDTSKYLLEVKENSVSIYKPLEKLAETYELGTEHSLYFEVKKIIDENIINENNEIYINHQYNFIHNLYRGSDSLLNFIGLWHGKKGIRYDYSDTYFYVEWLTSIQVIQHYSFQKSIECDTKFLFTKIKQR